MSAGLAQLVRASALQAGGQWFESTTPHHKTQTANTHTVCCWFKSNYLTFGVSNNGSSTEKMCLVYSGVAKWLTRGTLTPVFDGSNPSTAAKLPFPGYPIGRAKSVKLIETFFI